MILRIDLNAPTPPYEQLRSQLTTMIIGRVLLPGERMPSIRQLAKDLELAPGTVRRAYTELERNGLLYTGRGRHGTTVVDRTGKPAQENDGQLLREAASQFAVAALQSGATASEALAEARAALNRINGED